MRHVWDTTLVESGSSPLTWVAQAARDVDPPHQVRGRRRPYASIASVRLDAFAPLTSLCRVEATSLPTHLDEAVRGRGAHIVASTSGIDDVPVLLTVPSDVQWGIQYSFPSHRTVNVASV